MKTWKAVAILGVAGLALFIWWQAPLSPPALIKETQPSVVAVSALDRKGNMRALGTGFFVSKAGDIITNRHVIDGAWRIQVKTHNGKIYKVNQIVGNDKHSDLVCIRANVPPECIHPLSVETSLPQIGERVIVLGNPRGFERTASDGIVSAVRQVPGFGRMVQITAPVSPGSSGSPVINSKGRVIGVATFLVEGQNLNFSISGERIARLVHRPKDSDKKRRP